MTERSLQITYRKGRAFAAYLYFPHAAGENSVKTQASSDGLLVVDYAADGRALGVEITFPDENESKPISELCPLSTRVAENVAFLHSRAGVHRSPD